MATRDLEDTKTSAEITITQARERLTRLPEQMTRRKWTSLAVTRRGKPVLAVMPWGLYESLVETLEILGDPEMTAALRRSVEEIAAGRTYGLDDLRRELAEEQ